VNRHCRPDGIAAGEGRSPQNKHIMQIAEGAGIASGLVQGITAEATDALSDWESFADEAGLSKGTTRRIATALRGTNPLP